MNDPLTAPVLTSRPQVARAGRAWGWHLAAILLAGLALRLLFLPLPGFYDDNLGYQRWGVSIATSGLDAVYIQGEGSPNVPPVYLYLIAVDNHIGRIITGARGQPWSTDQIDPVFLMLHKCNGVLADLGAAGLLAEVLRRQGTPRRGLGAAAAYALNPALIYVSGYWGQLDGMLLALLLTSSLAIMLRRPTIAGALLGLMLAFKPQALFFVPLLSLVLLVQAPWTTADRQGKQDQQGAGRWLLHAGVAALAVLAVLWAPFILGESGWTALSVYSSSIGFYPVVTLYAFNVWWLLFGERGTLIVDSSQLLPGLSLARIGLGLLGAFIAVSGLQYGLALLQTFRHPTQPHQRFYLSALWLTIAALAFFLLPTQIHERYALYVLPLLLMMVIAQPGGAGWGLAGVWAAGGLVFLNLYYTLPVLPIDTGVRQGYGEIGGRAVVVVLLILLLVLDWQLGRARRAPAGAGGRTSPPAP